MPSPTPFTESDLSKLPKEDREIFEYLKAELNIANSQTEKAERRAEWAEERVKLLEERIRIILLKKYGPKSDKLSDNQLALFEEEPGVQEAEVEKEAARPEEEKRVVKKKREHFGRNKLPEHLERREEIVKVEEEKNICPCCQEKREVIGYEEKEILDMDPVKYFVRVYKREKVACRKCPEGGVETAKSKGPKIVEKGKLSDVIVVDVMVKKYEEHLPLYRQEASIEREHQIEVSRSTMCQAVMAAGGLLTPVVEVIKKDLLSGSYIQADESKLSVDSLPLGSPKGEGFSPQQTPVEVQSDVKQGKNHQGYVFEYSRPGGPVVFDFQMSRSREGPREFIGKYEGIMQCDGYVGYDKIGGPKIVMAGCLAHVRRGFVEAHKANPAASGSKEIVELIARLYGVEAKARREKLDASERKKLRQEQSVSLFEELKAEIIKAKNIGLPESKISQACRYALGQWSRLEVILEHGEVEIDNNWCENAIRPIALGRKNWQQIGSEDAGAKIAAIMSILATCKRLKISAREYLNEILPKLGEWPINRVSELTPMAWQAAR